MKKRILIISGGISKERAISIDTGKQVAKELSKNNYFVKIPFIYYELAYNIVEMRTLKEAYNSIKELTKLKDFPVEKLDIISLYLYVN